MKCICAGAFLFAAWSAFAYHVDHLAYFGRKYHQVFIWQYVPAYNLSLPPLEAVAARRGLNGHWIFHPAVMVRGFFYGSDDPEFQGIPQEITVAAPLLYLWSELA